MPRFTKHAWVGCFLSQILPAAVQRCVNFAMACKKNSGGSFPYTLATDTTRSSRQYFFHRISRPAVTVVRRNAPMSRPGGWDRCVARQRAAGRDDGCCRKAQRCSPFDGPLVSTAGASDCDPWTPSCTSSMSTLGLSLPSLSSPVSGTGRSWFGSSSRSLCTQAAAAQAAAIASSTCLHFSSSSSSCKTSLRSPTVACVGWSAPGRCESEPIRTSLSVETRDSCCNWCAGASGSGGGETMNEPPFAAVDEIEADRWYIRPVSGAGTIQSRRESGGVCVVV